MRPRVWGMGLALGSLMSALLFTRRSHIALAGGALCLLLAACVSRPSRPTPGPAVKPPPAPAQGSLAVYATHADGAPLAGAAIYLQSLDGGAPSTDAGVASNYSIDLIATQFEPRLLIVHTGTTVVFNNLDEVEHQIYSFSTDPPLNLDLRPGQSRRVSMPDHAAVMTLGCKIYNTMLGYVLVTDASVFGTADAGGFLRFQELPPGRYRVGLWYADPRSGARSELSSTATVISNQEQLVRFTLR